MTSFRSLIDELNQIDSMKSPQNLTESPADIQYVSDMKKMLASLESGNALTEDTDIEEQSETDDLLAEIMTLDSDMFKECVSEILFGSIKNLNILTSNEVEEAISKLDEDQLKDLKDALAGKKCSNDEDTIDELKKNFPQEIRNCISRIQDIVEDHDEMHKTSVAEDLVKLLKNCSK